MNKFSSFSINPCEGKFMGDKIKIKKVFDKDIIVLDFLIENSKYTDKGEEKCLKLQIEMNGQKHVLWTGSRVLMEMIQQVDRRSLPFQTVIKEEGETYQFT